MSKIPSCRNCKFQDVRDDLPIYKLEPRLGIKCLHPEVRNTSPLFITATTAEGRGYTCGEEGKFFIEEK